MSKQLSVVNTAADTFEVVIQRLNELVQVVNTEVLTANSSASGGQTTGNSWLYGIFGANTIVAQNLRGGNVASSGNLTITSNVFAQSFISVGNSTINAVVNSSALTLSNAAAQAVLTAQSLTIGTVFANSSVIRVGNSTVNAVINSTCVAISNSTSTAILDGTLVASLSDAVVFGTASTAGTSAQIVDTLERSQYRGCEYVVSIKQDGINASQISKMLVIDSGTGVDAMINEYGVISTNGTLGTFSANANSTHIRLIFTPMVSNTTMKFCKIRLGV